MPEEYIHFHRYSMGPEEKQALIDTLDSGWITKGPQVAQFEDDIKSYTLAEHALALNSCTAGLHLALLGLGIGPGDEVITTPLTFVATVNMILATGATAVLADIDPQTLNIDPQAIESKITSKTRAIIPVHIAGQPCDLEPILALAAQHQSPARMGIHVIDDAAHAIGAAYKGKKIGAWCDATVFSFYATKNITTGEGGMLLSSDQDLIEKTRPLSLHGLSKDAWKRYSTEGFQHYLVDAPGYKYNMTDLQAALGIVQLKKCDQLTQKRAKRVQIYKEALQDQPLDFQIEIPEIEHAHHLFPVRLQLEALSISRDQVLSHLQAAGIGCAVHFIPVHWHPYYKAYFGQNSEFKHADQTGKSLLSLPLYPDLSDAQQARVIDVFSQILKKYQR